jgi:adenylate cyclase
MVVGALAGPVIPVIFNGFRIGPIVNGVILGVVIGATSAVVENYLFQERFRRLPFSTVLVVRTIFYLTLVSAAILLVVINYQRVRKGIGVSDVLRDPDFLAFLHEGEFLAAVGFTLVASTSINFIRQINRLLGQNVLLSYITGRYHLPKEEMRIFLFLDLDGSTTLAEQLGNVRYHALLNDFFYDLTEPILWSDGEIYQYVGDEVVVTWPLARGVANANAVRCYYRIVEKITELAEDYRSRYGLVPTFKAGLHVGRVIVAEVGDIKKEIVFHGDPVNTVARILASCHPLGAPILVSSDLVALLPPIDGLAARSIGTIRLRGKGEQVELFTFTAS